MDPFQKGVAALVLSVGAAALLPPSGASAAEVAVTVENLSVPTLCAEEDNVHLTFSSPQVTGFRLVASHPAYAGTLVSDSLAADFTDCDMAGEPAFAATPRRVRIDLADDLWLVGVTYHSFWRPADVPLLVGDTRHDGFHLVQMFVARDGVAEEVLVVYPPDGYWRARPLSPAFFAPAPDAPAGHGTAYGTSFLVGPVTDDGRPVVALEAIRFDPDARVFHLSLAVGGTARLATTAVSRRAHAIDVAFEGIPDDRPFAALRSMYVTAVNNDAAMVASRAPEADGWREAPVMAYRGGRAHRLWLGRAFPSRHNTSAPDHGLGPFRDGR